MACSALLWYATLAYAPTPTLPNIRQPTTAQARLAVHPYAVLEHAHAAPLDSSSATLIADAANRLTDEAVRAADGTLGWWGSYIKTVEDGIFTLHDVYDANGVPFPYGFAIGTFVLGVKILTLPLNWNQLSSASSMKAVKPEQDRINKWYGDNSQFSQAAVGDLFEKLSINPLAGCLPSIAQIPVFLGVYYSVTSIAKAKIFNEGFLWIPNLSGPISDRTEGLKWLTENWANGAPPLGWADTLAYLTIPAILVCTQTVSLYLLGSFDALDDSKESQNTAAALKLLPFMIGWFAMNAPAGLGVYWIFNNVLTTTQTVAIKKLLEKDVSEPDVSDMLAAIGPRRSVASAASGEAVEWVPQAAAAAAVAPPAAIAAAGDEAEVSA